MTTPSIPATDEIYLRTEDVARILQMHHSTVRKWARRGRIPSQRTLGGHRRYPLTAIRALAAELWGEAQ